VPASLARVLSLKRVPQLAGLSGAVLAEPAVERFLPKGSVVHREGEPVGAVHVVVDGALGAWRGGRRLARIAAGEAVGGYGIFSRDPIGSQIVAEEDTQALELDADALIEVLEDRFSIVHHLLRELSRHVMDLIMRHRLDPALGLSAPAPFDGQAGELDLVDRLFFLRRQEIFRRTSLNSLVALARALTQVRFQAGTVLWDEGDPAGGIFLLVEGHVRARSEARGLGFRPGPGFPLGALEAMAERARFYEAVAETPLVALHTSTEVLLDVFEDSVDIALEYLGVLSRLAIRFLEAVGEPGDGAA
jgi:CRP-like cAMP-binding protein